MSDFLPIARRLRSTSIVAGLVLVCATGTLGCGQGGEENGAPVASAPGDDFSPVIAKVGDVTITRAYFDYRYENLNPQEKARYSGEGWEARFLDKLVQEMLVTETAASERYDLIRDVQWRLDMARRAILFEAFYERNFQDGIQVDEQELRDYYEQHKDTFRSMGRVYAQHVMTSSKEKIDQAWAELQDGDRFAEVAAKYSEDEATRDDAGTVGWFNRDGFVLGLGFNSEFTDYAFGMEAKTTSEPVKIGDKWHIIRVQRKVDDTYQSFEEVRDRIERQLKPVIAQEAFDRFLREQTREIGVERFGEFKGESRTAEQLYRLASESRNAHSRIYFYETLVDLYPEHERADDALFMLGFIASEEFGDTPQAARAFRRLVREYPDSEFAEQAQWMMGQLGGGTGLRGELSPTDAESASKALRDRQGP